MSRGKATLIENVLVLALMGVLAGAIGGLAIGIATSHSSTAASASH
jgi:type II secretory pathway pseudopilin PulG